MENFKCSFDELVDAHKLTPHPQNPNKHPEKQIERLAKIIDYQGQRSPVVVCKDTGFIIVGHGRLEAMKKLGWEKVAVNFQNFKDDAQRYAHMVADNAVADWAELDIPKINEDVLGLEVDLDTDLLGLEDFSIDDILESTSNEDTNYSRKIESPLYEIKGDKPSLGELVDTKNRDKLLSEIEESEVNPTLKEFLREAAQRHSVFNFEKIAEFYAHSSKEEQELMENSALVIVDFDKAIERGFINLSKDIQEACRDEF